LFLPDFLQFEPFNRLRSDMGAEELGDFTFFDPKRHVTGLERLSLGNEGLEVAVSELRVLNDFTLAYKDCRVVLYAHADETSSSEQNTGAIVFYHLADCPVVMDLRNVDPALSREGSWHVYSNGEALGVRNRVCNQCLQRLRYQNFDAVRQRHREYSERVEDAFSLADFFKRYPSYPLADSEQAPVF